MFRSNASRTILRSVGTASQPTLRTSNARLSQHFASQLCTLARRPQAVSIAKPVALQLLRAQSSTSKPGGLDSIDKKHELNIASKHLKADPETVSSSSSIHPIMGEARTEESGEKETDMMAGVKHDLQTIRDTFSLQDVPRQAYYIGLAGVLPYAATSLSTVYCAWEINHSAATGSGFLLSHKSAEIMLHIIEPLQVGYGATIISFLGAIHWGLEWAKFGGEQGYPRYAIGVVATAAAWPTILLPVEYALISQFLIFNFLYYTDSRASKTGWAPPWYAVYRFVLTFIVGSSIVVSLIGRGQIVDQIGRLPGPAERVKQLREQQVVEQEEEEEARRKYLVEKDESDDDE